MVKKVLKTLHEGTPHKARLALVLLWAIFAATVLNSVLIITTAGM